MSAPIRPLQLVVVDDDSSMVRLLSHVARQGMGERVNIVEMTDPVKAREWLDGNCCDILLTDLQMPGLDGLELLRFAKRRNAWTQVLFMTAHSTWDTISEAIENGASDYLLKPVNQFELVELLHQAYERFVRWQSAVGQTMRQRLVTTR
ncbi:MAG: response regulator [Pirellulales bacterium]|nr:response regulator [Pirellulales bacterium]